MPRERTRPFLAPRPPSSREQGVFSEKGAEGQPNIKARCSEIQQAPDSAVPGPIALTSIEAAWFRRTRWRCHFCSGMPTHRTYRKLLCATCAHLEPQQARIYADSPVRKVAA